MSQAWQRVSRQVAKALVVTLQKRLERLDQFTQPPRTTYAVHSPAASMPR
ncbi:hypothetical protein RBSWK_06132 [Rhodopirellula baltica SWK14]|uniref:Uncharacterized protein n=1 Tax=Rhodopirellula baltica SWK14 TaxID=993516 RepID=L7C776_RHOBT|nr:hypothetical protein RBSWK_06132 [Rhodopirellula baltica SWK14]